MATTQDLACMATYWHEAYIAAAEAAYPDVTKGHDLAVGWKVTKVDSTSSHDYYWPLVNGYHDLPVLHEADDWDPGNSRSCPGRRGDGLCLISSPEGISEATSGVVDSLGRAVMHVLVYPADLAEGDTTGKRRSPWVIDVDCADVIDLVSRGLVANLSEANLTRADLTKADLTRADLTRADLTKAYLTRANLSGANLSGAYLCGADLSGAYLYGANLTRADLTRADLTRADLSGAYLYGAGLSGADLSGAYCNKSTRWPDGFVVPSTVAPL